MKKSIFAIFAAGTLAAISFGANAAVIISNGTAGYYNAGLGTSLDTNGPSDPFPCANVACQDFTVAYPAAPNLAAAAGQLGTWLTNAAPTGGAWSAAPEAIPANWTVNTETAIVYEINAGSGLTNASLTLGVDNGIFVWLNGNYLFGARAAGGSFLGEYSLNLANMTGTNYLQILREDHGGGTGYGISLNADRAVLTSVPEPASLALMGLGLAGLGLARRRKQG